MNVDGISDTRCSWVGLFTGSKVDYFFALTSLTFIASALVYQDKVCHFAILY